MSPDRSAVRQRIAIVPFDGLAYHVFVRTGKGAVEHYWATQDGEMGGPETFGDQGQPGLFHSEPVALEAFDGTRVRLHLIGRSIDKIMDWHWDATGPPGPLGVPVSELLPGISVADPFAIASRSGLEVFAASIDGPLRHWSRHAGGWTLPESLGGGMDPTSRPTAISRQPDVLDVFAAGGGLSHWTNASGSWVFESRGGGPLVGEPTAASYEPERMDVFAVRDDGQLVHWGWDGRWFPAELSLEMPPGVLADTSDPRIQLVAYGDRRLRFFARSTRGDVLEWFLDPPEGWDGSGSSSASAISFAAWSSQASQVDVTNRTTEGGFIHDTFVEDPSLAIEDPSGLIGSSMPGRWESMDLSFIDLERLTSRPIDIEPDSLLVRPRDLVMLGMRFRGCDVVGAPGAPAELVAGPAAELIVIFPPQHMAEEVVAAQVPVTPGIDPATTGGLATWRAQLSRSSTVAVGLDQGDRVPLTVEGVLEALRRGRLLSSESVLDDKTAIELPYGLVISPTVPQPAVIRCAHPAAPVPSQVGSVGLWQTTIAVDGTPAGAPAGLTLRAIGVAKQDPPFPVPLPVGTRGRIALEPPTARLDRLSLSALGGSITAAGSWDTFEWEHVAALGRDRRVRTATKGVLYPLGHRAEYVEVTQRVFRSRAEGAIAHLVISRSLRITEPVRRGPSVDHPDFPFTEVELERTYFDDLDEPTWGKEELPLPVRTELEALRDENRREARRIRRELFPDGELGAIPLIEDVVSGHVVGSAEPLDPDDPDSQTPAGLAFECLQHLLSVQTISEQIAALGDAATSPVNVFFVPHHPRDRGRAGVDADRPPKPVRFGVRLAGRLGDVHISMPLVFVADITLDQGLLTPEFKSLTDSTIAGRVRQEYEGVDEGSVEVGGARIDLVRSSTPADADVCEVQRLHIVGEAREGGFRPRLGDPPLPDEGTVPAAGRWAFEAALPAVRTLLGTDQPMRLAWSRSFLESGPEVEIPFQVPGSDDPEDPDAGKVITTFAKNPARSGGIVAPDIVADGISRVHGLVNVAGMLDRVGEHLDPAKVLGNTATLMGFRLADLIDGTALSEPPTISSATDATGAPIVKLQWRDIKLATTEGAFLTTEDSRDDTGEPVPGSRLDLDVALGAADQKIECTLTKVALALPDRDEQKKLLEVGFEKIVFSQTGGKAPDLSVSGIGAKFFGLLRLLEDLQDAVDLAGAGGPGVEASSRGVTARYTLPVPDVTTGAFHMTGLVFHAGIDVPFDERPVAISLAFASRQKPFNLSVMAFGGGGYVDILIDGTGLRRLEIALEFGASVAVNFVVAFGEVHALGGVRLVKVGDDFSLMGYLRLGGTVTVLGLVSASVELTVSLEYKKEQNRMVGRAMLVLEVDLTLFSESVTLDSGEWVLAGDTDEPGRARPAITDEDPIPAMEAPDPWDVYRSAFAAGSVP